MSYRLAGSILCGFCVALLCGASATAEQDTDTRIPRGSRLYIDKIEGGYDIYLSAAMVKKEVPVTLVIDRGKADFELTGVTESDKAGWAKMLFMGSTSTAESASIKVVNLKTGTVAFAYNVNKSNSARGKQSSSEACAKHLKEKIDETK
jgi:hypothetical protein